MHIQRRSCSEASLRVRSNRLTNLLALSCLAGFGGAPHHAVAQSGPECLTGPSLKPQDIPADVCAHPTGTKLEAFDSLAWQTFKMLVWPASTQPQVRGIPDEARAITNMQGPRTFETYKADWETFLPQATPPNPWGTYAISQNPCTNNVPIGPGDLVLASFSEFGNIREPGYKNLTNVLVAQNGTFVRYLAAYDQHEFELIRSNRLYEHTHLPNSPLPSGTSSPIPKITQAPNGAMTVKSAWIEMTSRIGNPSHFYIRTAWLQDPKTSFCRKALVGLVGLHFVHKTPSSPQWIWSTFEHVDNVPGRDPTLNPAYTFNNGNAAEHMPTQAPPEYDIGNIDPNNPPRPVNVERLKPIADETTATNYAWQQALHGTGSVWQYYMLVMTEWPGIANAPDRDGLSAQPTPPCITRYGTALSNTTMETFLQKDTSSCKSGTTCMGCHNGARATDFVWSMPMNAKTTAYLEETFSPRLSALSALRRIVERSH
jgi:hypothetical protein